jgi:hypothetical protein
VASIPLDLYQTLQLHLAIANGLHLLKRVAKDNTGGITKNATTVSYNPYNLMHNPT